MAKFKVTEYRTTPYIFEVEAEDGEKASELDSNWGKVVYLGRNDDIDVSTEVEEIMPHEKIWVEYKEKKRN